MKAQVAVRNGKLHFQIKTSPLNRHYGVAFNVDVMSDMEEIFEIMETLPPRQSLASLQMDYRECYLSFHKETFELEFPNSKTFKFNVFPKSVNALLYLKEHLEPY